MAGLWGPRTGMYLTRLRFDGPLPSSSGLHVPASRSFRSHYQAYLACPAPLFTPQLSLDEAPRPRSLTLPRGLHSIIADHAALVRVLRPCGRHPLGSSPHHYHSYCHSDRDSYCARHHYYGVRWQLQHWSYPVLPEH